MINFPQRLQDSRFNHGCMIDATGRKHCNQAEAVNQD